VTVGDDRCQVEKTLIPILTDPNWHRGAVVGAAAGH
jgi:hypothetical protein